MVTGGGENTARRWTLQDKGATGLLVPKGGQGVSGPSSTAWNSEQVSIKIEFRKQKPLYCSKELGVCEVTGWPRDRKARCPLPQLLVLRSDSRVVLRGSGSSVLLPTVAVTTCPWH